MKRGTRSIVTALLGIALFGAAALPANAQSLSNRPVRMVLPYPPGGPTDLTARLVADAISTGLGVSVLVENKPGATGKIAAEAVARAEPDGHTLLVASGTQLIVLPLLDKTLSFKPFETFRMVSIFTNYDIVFMASPTAGVKTMKDLVAKMQNKAEDVTYASIGTAQLTPTGLAYLVLTKMTQGNAREINYAGQAPGMLDLLAGRVTYATYTLTGAMGHIQSGKILALAVASPTRLSQLPDTPTMTEAGFPEFSSANNWLPWISVVAPAKTPEAIVNSFNRAIVQAAKTDAFKAKFAPTGLNVVATGAAAQDQQAWQAEYERLSATLKRFDIQLPPGVNP